MIKLHRLNRGLTLEELATLMNTDRHYIWKIENGKLNMSIDYLERLLAALNCKPEDFFKNQ